MHRRAGFLAFIVLALPLAASGAAGTDAAPRAADLPAPPRGRESPRDLLSASQGRTIRIGEPNAGGDYTATGVPLEEYVARVVAGEQAPGSAPAALEALAIAARTFALANLGRHRHEGFDLCTLTHCQVTRPNTVATRQAALTTAGRILLYLGRPASIFFHASCGGRSEIPSAVWPGASDPPFLKSHGDSCRDLPGWTSEISAADLTRALAAAGFRGRELRGLRAVQRSASGRVTRLRLEGLAPDEISGQQLRAAIGRVLGWQRLKSTAFDVGRSGDGFRFRGRGSGHGVGLCTIGSAAMASQRRSTADILAAYFPGIEAGPIPSDVLAALAPPR